MKRMVFPRRVIGADGYTEPGGWRQIQRMRDVCPSNCGTVPWDDKFDRSRPMESPGADGPPGAPAGQESRLCTRCSEHLRPGRLRTAARKSTTADASWAIRLGACEAGEGSVGDTATRRWAFVTSRRRTDCQALSRVVGIGRADVARAADWTSTAAPLGPAFVSKELSGSLERGRLGNGYAMRLPAASRAVATNRRPIRETQRRRRRARPRRPLPQWRPPGSRRERRSM